MLPQTTGALSPSIATRETSTTTRNEERQNKHSRRNLRGNIGGNGNAEPILEETEVEDEGGRDASSGVGSAGGFGGGGGNVGGLGKFGGLGKAMHGITKTPQPPPQQTTVVTHVVGESEEGGDLNYPLPPQPLPPIVLGAPDNTPKDGDEESEAATAEDDISVVKELAEVTKVEENEGGIDPPLVAVANSPDAQDAGSVPVGGGASPAFQFSGSMGMGPLPFKSASVVSATSPSTVKREEEKGVGGEVLFEPPVAVPLPLNKVLRIETLKSGDDVEGEDEGKEEGDGTASYRLNSPEESIILGEEEDEEKEGDEEEDIEATVTKSEDETEGEDNLTPTLRVYGDEAAVKEGGILENKEEEGIAENEEDAVGAEGGDKKEVEEDPTPTLYDEGEKGEDGAKEDENEEDEDQEEDANTDEEVGASTEENDAENQLQEETGNGDDGQELEDGALVEEEDEDEVNGDEDADITSLEEEENEVNGGEDGDVPSVEENVADTAELNGSDSGVVGVSNEEKEDAENEADTEDVVPTEENSRIEADAGDVTSTEEDPGQQPLEGQDESGVDADDATDADGSDESGAVDSNEEEGVDNTEAEVDADTDDDETELDTIADNDAEEVSWEGYGKNEPPLHVQEGEEQNAPVSSSTEEEGHNIAEAEDAGAYKGDGFEEETARVAASPIADGGVACPSSSDASYLSVTQCRLGVSAHSHPLAFSSAIFVALFLCFCCVRCRFIASANSKRRRDRLGEYSVLGEHEFLNGQFSDDVSFGGGDSFADEDESDEGESDDDSAHSYGSDEGGVGGNGFKIEMGNIHEQDANGGLTLEEING